MGGGGLGMSHAGEDAFLGGMAHRFHQQGGGRAPCAGFRFLQGRFAIAAIEEQAEGFLDFGALLGAESTAFEADGIERCESIDFVCKAVRGDIQTQAGHPLHHGVIADADELVKHTGSTDDAAVAENHMSGHQNVVGQNIVAAHHDIMPKVHAGHDEIVVANDGVGICHRGAMNGHVFAQAVVFTEDHTGVGLRVEAQILGIGTDHAAPADLAARADGAVTADQHVAVDDDIVADGGGTVDDGEGPDFHVFTDNGCG